MQMNFLIKCQLWRVLDFLVKEDIRIDWIKGPRNINEELINKIKSFKLIQFQ